MGGERSELCCASAMKRIPEKLTTYARALRNSSTKAERLLWVRLRQYRPRFTRQLVVESYIVDLACREAKLAIELDGSQHAEAVDYDVRRTAFLEGQAGRWSGSGTMRLRRIRTGQPSSSSLTARNA